MDTVTFNQFSAVDIRMGTVTKADVPEWSHWVMRITVDLGPEIGEKKCFSGIMKFFKPEEFIGKNIKEVGLNEDISTKTLKGIENVLKNKNVRKFPDFHFESIIQCSLISAFLNLIFWVVWMNR